MLATLIIGLREGLEAALIVGIIAAFLRRNGRSLTQLLLGVGAAIALSVLVGIGLRLVELGLPQAAQEAMEAIIGAVAVCFVTSMLIWMATHAAGLKRGLEASATAALSARTGRALAVMGFLAVLKEGMETAVFLLATLSAAGNPALPATGAVLGLLISAGVGYGIYTGGLRINLGRFFKATSVFLLLVAAGLVASTLGKLREAGWLNAGQARTVDLSWLAPPGSIQGALLTGVLGIPPDPRLIQVIGWFAFAVPMALYLYLPKRLRPTAASAARLRLAVAGGLAIAALTLLAVLGPPRLPVLAPAVLVDAQGRTVGSIRVVNDRAVIVQDRTESVMPLTGGTPGPHLSVPDAVGYRAELPPLDSTLPATLTLAELVTLNSGRLPVGINPQLASGPFVVTWTRSGERRLWLVAGEVLDFSQTETVTATLNGGGLPSPRTLTVSGRLGGIPVSQSALALVQSRVIAAETAARLLRAEQVERDFWGRVVPIVLGVAALATAGVVRRTRARPAAAAAQPSENGRIVHVG